MRQESDLQGREARRVSKPVPSPIGLRIQIQSPQPTTTSRAEVFDGGRSGARTHKALAGSAVFETAAVVQHSACPSMGSCIPERVASGSNARTAHHRGRCFPSRPLTSRAATHAFLALSGRAPEGAAESGLIESHALRHASGSNGARHACPVHSPGDTADRETCTSE